LKKNIGMAYVPAEFASVGQEIQIDVRGKLGRRADCEDAVLQTGKVN
jgi:glycine cleavage system aminomethyltransferase T